MANNQININFNSNNSNNKKDAAKPANPTQSAKPAKIKTKTKSPKKPLFKNNKNTVYIACGIVAIVSIAIIAGVIISRLNRPPISEETFVTNDVQSTIDLNPDNTVNISDPNALQQTHLVYEYDGDNVVGLKTYFEYPSPEAAQTAYEARKDQPEFKGAVVNDRYIVVTADPEQFKGLTADDIRQQAEAIKQFQESQKAKETPADTSSDTPSEEPSEEPAPEEEAQPEE